MLKQCTPLRGRELPPVLLLILALALLCPFTARAGNENSAEPAAVDAAPAPPTNALRLGNSWKEGEVTLAEPAPEPPEYRRYAMLCMANAYPGLKSEDLINNLFDPIMGAIAPGIEEINTFGDMRDNHLLWVPNFGGGYNISRHFSLFLQLGYGAGPVRTEDSSMSVLLMPLHLFFEMRRSAFTITPGLDYFPFGMVEQRDYHGLKERLRAIRPMFGVRIPWTHAGYKAHVKLGLGPVKKLVDIKFGETWDIWSTNLNAGFDVPITRRNQVNVNLGHSFFFGHDSDFGGTVFSVTWKYLF